MAELVILRRWSVGSDFLLHGRSLSQRSRFRATYFQGALGLVAQNYDEVCARGCFL